MLTYATKNHKVDIEVSDNGAVVNIYLDKKVIASFSTIELWDMLKYKLASTDIPNDDMSGLMRRKTEAIITTYVKGMEANDALRRAKRT